MPSPEIAPQNDSVGMWKKRAVKCMSPHTSSSSTAHIASAARSNHFPLSAHRGRRFPVCDSQTCSILHGTLPVQASRCAHAKLMRLLAVQVHCLA